MVFHSCGTGLIGPYVCNNKMCNVRLSYEEEKKNFFEFKPYRRFQEL